MSANKPPEALTTRAGGAHEQYEFVAEHNRMRILGLLGDDWSFKGKRVLDFGCGAGRSLQVFAKEAEEAEFWGCDLHAPSIEWAREHLSPPFSFVLNGADPPTELQGEFFDLVWGVSAFTHVTDNWAEWLLEIHRVTKPGALILFSILGDKMWRNVLQREYDEDKIGMVISMPHRPWDHGGPDAFHSEWWLREHWGRVFEIVELDKGQPEMLGHDWIIMRRDERTAPTVEALKAPADDPRELASAQTNIELLEDQLRELYTYTTGVDEGMWAARNELKEALEQRDETRQRYDAVVTSKSWTLTEPLRNAVKRVRSR
jgi:SAM-dependent methyltransferase